MPGGTADIHPGYDVQDAHRLGHGRSVVPASVLD